MSEEWRPVVGWEGCYEVSNLGRVRGVVSGVVLKARLHRSGYLDIRIGSAKNRRGYFVHALVSRAFLGPCPPGLEVDHLDGNKVNNRPGNFEYVTRKENLRRASVRLEPARAPLRRARYLARLQARRAATAARGLRLGTAERDFEPLSEEEKAHLRGTWKREQQSKHQ